MNRLLVIGVVATLSAAAAPNAPSQMAPERLEAKDGTPIIVLHQTACQFRGAEEQAVVYAARTRADCQKINRATHAMRKPKLRQLRLRAGRYVFRVYNDDVPYSVGFALRGAYEKGLPHIEGDGIEAGTGKDFVIDLRPGQYLFGGPNNPTPDYPLLVER